MRSLSLKQKILGIIILIVLSVMAASSLVVSWVIHGQNVTATRQNLESAALNIRQELTKFQAEVVRKCQSMNRLHKADENIGFLKDFKSNFDLSMTRDAYESLAKSLYLTASADAMDTLVYYDHQGELLAWCRSLGQGAREVGYFYVNPARRYCLAQLGAGEEFSTANWTEVSVLPPSGFSVSHGDALNTEIQGQFIPKASRLILQTRLPVTAKVKAEGEASPVIGRLLAEKNLGAAFLENLASLTGMPVNLFVENRFALGALPAYESLALPTEAQDPEAPMIPGEVTVGDHGYYQALLPFYIQDQLAAALVVLSSDGQIMANTLQVVYVLGGVFLGCLVLIIPLAWFFSGTLVASILTVKDSLKDVAQGDGDLTQRIQTRSRDEIGALSHWFNVFTEKLQQMMGKIAASSGLLSGTVEKTRDQVGAIARKAEGMAEITQTVTQSARTMSDEIGSTAGLVETASDNLARVASAAEQMNAVIQEIAGRTDRARTMGRETGEKIEAASRQMSQLGQDAQKIDAFTQSISEISAQTNLLALNATIEAARAGEAGKGFAVVAGEIKALAAQTAEAAEDIQLKVETIQASSERTHREMDGIAQAFGRMSDLVNEVAAAMAQQSAATKDIAGNTATAAQGIGEVNAVMGKLDEQTSRIAEDMETLDRDGRAMSENCAHIRRDTGEMNHQTQKLDDLIQRFVIE